MAQETLDEFQRIRQFYAPLAGPGGFGLLDDAALVDCRGGRRLVVTADAMSRVFTICLTIRPISSHANCCASICPISRRWGRGRCTIC